MKLKFLLSLLITMLFSSAVYANTVITAPIDSRPISTDYLGNLTALNSDILKCVDKENLDYFSADESKNHLGDSQKVRDQIAEFTSQHNTAGTTVIINTSSYITNGLVGSRCGINYKDCDKALADLDTLVNTYRQPKYYINIQMPRVLPETRFNTIWPNDQKVRGLGWYYLKHNPDYVNADELKAKYAEVTPTQFLMEYGYIYNKIAENGYTSLTPWENEFYHYIRKNYDNKQGYKECISSYKLPFEKIKYIFAEAVRLQQAGLVDDIVVSNDDLQLPQSITYLYGNGGNEDNWINSEKGSAVKYSYARSALQIDKDSIINQIAGAYGLGERGLAQCGQSSKVNIIYGTDEIPQLIYARSLAQRKKCIANFDVCWNELQSGVAAYDVKSPHTILKTDMSFVSGGLSASGYTDKKFRLYVWDYSKNYNQLDYINMMNKDYREGKNVGLIELYSSGTLNTGDNSVFKRLLATKPAERVMTLAQLKAYSAWNTNGNAIGLGIAHAQVYAIAEQTSPSKTNLINAQMRMLGQHVYEDGIYTCEVKRLLANKGFKPEGDDLVNSTMLYSMLHTEEVNNVFKASTYKLGDKTYRLTKFDISRCCFPWGRTFDCYIDIDVNSKSA